VSDYKTAVTQSWLMILAMNFAARAQVKSSQCLTPELIERPENDAEDTTSEDEPDSAEHLGQVSALGSAMALLFSIWMVV
jgi:hypothetical protein